MAGAEKLDDSLFEQGPRKFLYVTNMEAGLAGTGFIPPEAINGLVRETLPISGFLTDEGEPAWAVVSAHDIAMSLGSDGGDPSHWPAVWWLGYADAFKSAYGELSNTTGFIRIPLSNGEIFEAANDEQVCAFLDKKNDGH